MVKGMENGNMSTTITVDKTGRVLLPKPVQDQLQLSAGDSLELELSEDSIVLRPVRETAGMRQKEGIIERANPYPPLM